MKKLYLAISMVIFGTIGLIRRYIPLPSATVAMVRGVTGSVFMLCVYLFMRRKPDLKSIKGSLGQLALSGAFLGLNWLMLFEAYNRTSVAVATVCYYMAPVIVMLLSPVLLGERITPRGAICGAVSVVGMLLVSGILTGDGAAADGILFGLGAACLYAGVMIMNRKIKNIASMDRTLVQLAVSALVLMPYVIFAERPDFATCDGTGILCLALAGILHTGIAYMLFFSAVAEVPAQSAAVMSYIDPAVAVIVSVVFLASPMSIAEICGAVLVIGSALVNEAAGSLERKS